MSDIISKSFSSVSGTVSQFDESSGLGAVHIDGGSFRFHCIEIADGTRTIEVGARVVCRLEPRMGSFEAVHLERA